MGIVSVLAHLQNLFNPIDLVASFPNFFLRWQEKELHNYEFSFLLLGAVVFFSLFRVSGILRCNSLLRDPFPSSLQY